MNCKSFVDHTWQRKITKKMSSFEEANVYQMFDDFLEPKSIPQTPLVPISSNTPFISDHHAKYYILQEIVESGTNIEINVLGSVIKHLRKSKLVEGGVCNDLKKWLVKCLKKDGYNASLCHTYWPTTPNYPGGEYECIDILCEHKRGGGSFRVIVDVDFKSQFEVARPTSNHKELCDLLPSIFVGDELKLNKIISILCGEADNSFRESGLYVPPWRTTGYMLCKWFSSHRELPSIAPERRFCVANAPKKVEVVVSSKMSPRRKYLEINRCGLSNEFSMTMKCN